ncbi:MAG: hypothetical protein IT236_09260 [Bacteroidia bacterium]|nr:hypothetical protein [Bacteroidia bacterium]
MAKNTERDYQIKLNAEKNAQAEFQGWSVKRLIAEILKIRKERTHLENKYNSLIQKQELKSDEAKPTYNQKWTYPQKVCFILLSQQRPMTSSQIYEALTKADKHFEDFRDPLAILNSYLSRMLVSGRLNAHKLPGIRKHFYILPEWLEADKTLKAEYAAHLNFLS